MDSFLPLDNPDKSSSVAPWTPIPRRLGQIISQIESVSLKIKKFRGGAQGFLLGFRVSGSAYGVSGLCPQSCTLNPPPPKKKKNNKNGLKLKP